MKNKKKTIIYNIIFIVLIGIVCFIATGRERTDVYLKDFDIDKKCNTMTLKVDVSSSSGYIRDIKTDEKMKNMYITFYSTYGINSKLGAKDTFEIQLDNINKIYFYTKGKSKATGYKLILEKNEHNEWVSVKNKYDDYNSVISLKKVDYASIYTLVRFDGILYGKSNTIIDYTGETEKLGVIDKIIDDMYVPKLNNETNKREILNAEVYDRTDKSIVLFYNNEYVLFEVINE